MKNKYIFFTTILLTFIGLFIYLFVSAPLPLDNKLNSKNIYSCSVEDALRIVATENDIIRTHYTKNIVGKGKKAGLKFDEKWADDEVEAGPLPALFLRATSGYLEKSKVPLGLYLGSDFPISEANLLKGIQAEKFKELKKDKKARFFYDESTQRYTAMFPDFASAPACVSCHNQHIQSPKKDWKLNDVMGATTWTYPKDSLTTDEVIEIVKVFRESAEKTYEDYLKEVRNFKRTEIPLIGEKWPEDGYFLPTKEIWSQQMNQLTAPYFVQSLMAYNEK